MRLDIDDNSLHDMLQGKKDYIGGSWINGVINIVGGMSFIITIYSAKISLLWIKLLLYVVAFFLGGIGIVQFFKNIGKQSYNYEKLYDDIKNLSVSDSRYSLIAILNNFEGDSANKVLLKYFKGGWQTYMFLSYPSASENDENNVISRVAASLKVERNYLKVKFLTEVPYQSKYSLDRKSVRMYHNKYYQVFISNFSDILKKSEFTLDGTKYKWMTLEEMWDNEQIKANNADVLREFEKYIFNTRTQLTDTKFSFSNISNNIYIRLNRVCNLSCAFCLAENVSSELSTEQLKNILKILKSHGFNKARLTGGEPTLRSDFFEIVKYSIGLGFRTIVYSNLCISDKTINELMKYRICVSTSIHGDEKFHDSVTQKGAYKKTYSNILKLKSANIPVTIHMVVMSKNISLAETVVEDAIRAGVEKVTFQTLIPREKGAELFNEGENVSDIRGKLKSLYPLKEKYEPKITIGFSDLYEKGCYVLETNGAIYLQKGDNKQDEFIGELI